MDNKTLKYKKIARKIVDAVVPSSFMKTNKCSQQICKRVKQRIFEDALMLLQKMQYCNDIILTQKQKVQAILHSEILLAEQKSLNNGLNVVNDNEENKSIKPAKKDSVVVNSYFEHLSQYKKDTELFNRVKGLEMRGKKYKVSNDGSCPKCSFKKNVFVILDFLFLSGDMPEILQYLMAKGNAILWSSKGATSCKDPPTFLCSGRCPSDVSKSGFNINWGKTDLEKIYFDCTESIEKTEIDIPQDESDSSITSEQDMDDEEFLDEDLNQSDYSDEEYDEGLVDINYYRSKVMWVVLDEVVEERDKLFVEEEAAIRTMLALEEARNDYITGEMKVKSVDAEEISIFMKQEESSDNKNPLTAMNLSVDTTIETSSLVDNETVFSNSSSLISAGSAARDMLTNAGSAARDILRRENKSKMVPIKTPTHILKLPSLYTAKEVKKPAFTAADFPVSSDGACPYCKSTNVVYIIIQDDDLKEDDLPPLLMKLLREENAKKVKKGDYDLPSFQCKQCTYGFNLDWSMSSLETIFLKKDNKKKVKRKANIYEQQTAYAPYYASYYGYQQPCYISNQWMGYVPHNQPVNPYTYGSYYGYYSQASNLQEAYGSVSSESTISTNGNVSNESNTISTSGNVSNEGNTISTYGNVSNEGNTISTNGIVSNESNKISTSENISHENITIFTADNNVAENHVVGKTEILSADHKKTNENNVEDILPRVKESSDNKAACENEDLSLQEDIHKMSETNKNDSLIQMNQFIDPSHFEVNKLIIKMGDNNGELKIYENHSNTLNDIFSKLEQNDSVSDILGNDTSLNKTSDQGAKIYFSNDSVQSNIRTDTLNVDKYNKCSPENALTTDSSNTEIHFEETKSFKNDHSKINHSPENKNEVNNEDETKLFSNLKLKVRKNVTKRVTRSSLLSVPHKKFNLDLELSEINDKVCEASSLNMMASTDKVLQDLSVNKNVLLTTEQVLNNLDSDISTNTDSEFIDTTSEIKVETLSNTKSKNVRGRRRGRGRRKQKL